MSLTPKQELFCQEYLIDLNATRAAKAAGYSEKSAHDIGSENLRKPEIQARLSELRGNLMDKLEISKERVVTELARLALFDVRKLYHNDGSPKSLADLDDDTAAAIVGLDVALIGNSEVGQGTVLKYKMADKKGALESIGKHLGMFVDRVEHSGPEGGPIEVSSSIDTARRVAFALARGAKELAKQEKKDGAES